MVAGRGPSQEDRVVTGIEVLPDLERLGFDYIELSLSDIMKLDESEFTSMIQHLEKSTVKCEVCHNFIPSNIRLTGPKAEVTVAEQYIERAFQRAARLGVEIIVFGSSGARNIPTNFPERSARQQLVGLLATMGDLAEEYKITVVIEPLNRKESNIITTLGEALYLSREVNHRRIKVLYDYYHMIMENEDPDIIFEAGKEIRHVHISEPEKRAFPLKPKQSYQVHFQSLRDIEYHNRVSIEAYTENFEADAARSLKMLRSLTVA
jgi:sugar phosphate isomerase/epimerase